MASYARKNAVRVVAVAVLAGATLTAIAGLAEAWKFTVVAGAGTVGLLAVLVVAVARRQHRATGRVEADVIKAVRALRYEVSRDCVVTDELNRLRVRGDSNGQSLEDLATHVKRLEAAILHSSDYRDEESRLLDLKLTRLHSSMLTDAQALNQLMAQFRPVEPLPAVAGWAMSPSGLLWLTRHVLHSRPSLVVECGSGTSTLWTAMALREAGQGKLITFEHKEEFATQTRNKLSEHGLTGWAEVIDAPLESVETPRGTFDWYSQRNLLQGPIDLLMVDGPPGNTGPNARYPALPVLCDYMSDGAVVVVDDMHRKDEQRAVANWLREIEGLTRIGEVAKDVVALRFSKP